MADTALEEASAANEAQQHAGDGEEPSADPYLSGDVGGDELDPSASAQSTSAEGVDEGDGEGPTGPENGELEEGEEPMTVAEGNGEVVGDGVEEGEEGEEAMDVSEQGGREEGEAEEGEVGGGEGENGQEEGEVPDDAEEGEIFAEQVRFESQPDPAQLAEIDTKLFVGGLNRSVTEEDVRTLFAAHGEVEEVRIMMDKRANQPKGYGFVRYKEKEDAKKAYIALNGYSFHGRTLEVGPSEGNRRLAVSNVDPLWNLEEFESLLRIALKGTMEHVAEVTLDEDKSGGQFKNRGVGVIVFKSHEAAREALSSLHNSVTVAGRPLRLDFAKQTPRASAQSRRTLFISRLPSDTTKAEVEEIFHKFGRITKLWVALLDSRTPPKGRSDYAFVAFDSDAAFNRALEETRDASIRGHKLDISRAKPTARLGREDDGPGRREGRRDRDRDHSRGGDRRRMSGGGGMGPRAHVDSLRGPPPPLPGRGLGSLAVEPPPSRQGPPGESRGGPRGPPPPPVAAPYYPSPSPGFEDRKRRGRSQEWDEAHPPAPKRGRMGGHPGGHPHAPPPMRGRYDDPHGPPPPRDDWGERRGGGGARGGPPPYAGGGGYRDAPPAPMNRGYRERDREPRDRDRGDDRYRRSMDGGRPMDAGRPDYPPSYAPDPYYDRPRGNYPPPARGAPYPRGERAPSPYRPPPAPYALPPPPYHPAPPAPYAPAPRGPRPYDYGPPQHGPPQQDYSLPAPPAALPKPPPSLHHATVPPPSTGVTTGPRGPVSTGISSLAGRNKLMPPGASGGAKLLLPPGAKSAGKGGPKPLMPPRGSLMAGGSNGEQPSASPLQPGKTGQLGQGVALPSRGAGPTQPQHHHMAPTTGGWGVRPPPRR